MIRISGLNQKNRDYMYQSEIYQQLSDPEDIAIIARLSGMSADEVREEIQRNEVGSTVYYVAHELLRFREWTQSADDREAFTAHNLAFGLLQPALTLLKDMHTSDNNMLYLHEELYNLGEWLKYQHMIMRPVCETVHLWPLISQAFSGKGLPQNRIGLKFNNAVVIGSDPILLRPLLRTLVQLLVDMAHPDAEIMVRVFEDESFIQITMQTDRIIIDSDLAAKYNNIHIPQREDVLKASPALKRAHYFSSLLVGQVDWMQENERDMHLSLFLPPDYNMP